MLRIGFYGFGSIGRLAARLALERGYEVVGAVDIDPSIVGKDVGEVIGVGRLGAPVSRDVGVLADAEVVIHATGSYLDKVYPQILELIKLGVNVVSTCETLAYPWYRYPILARRLDWLAQSYNVTVIGTGINPGFLLDTLVAILASSVSIVEKITAIRSLDATKRRKPFQKKIGMGLDPETAKRMLAEGQLTGHVGYAESVMLIADAAGIQPARVIEGQDVVVAEKDYESGQMRIEKGKVLGIKGYGAAIVDNKEVIRIEFHAYAGAEEYDEIRIEGKHYDVTWRSSGTPGDLGTASVVLGVADITPELLPGLLTMADLVPLRPKIQAR